MSGLLLFGTLMDDALRRIVAGADLPGRRALLPGRGARCAAEGSAPVLADGSGAKALWTSPGSDMLDRLDYYAAAHGQVRISGEAQVDGAPVTAWIYQPETPAQPTTEVWSLAEWQRQWGPLTRAAAAEAMALHGRLGAQALGQALPTMRMRAAARLRAGNDPAPVIRRAGFVAADIRIEADDQPYTGYFALREATLRHPQFAGGQSAGLRRAAFLCGDAVTVLPYDPARDAVLLVEQFRFGAFARGDRHPWCLEPVAGRVDPGEVPEQTARRETREETGLSLRKLIPVANYYPSPGAVTEYLYSFIGLAELPDSAAGLGGLEAEGEDIRAHVLPFAELQRLIELGEVDNAPLLISAFWLAPRRRELA